MFTKLAALVALQLISFSLSAQVLSSNQVNIIARSIFIAEGGTNAAYLYGIRSEPYHGTAEARQICKTSIINAYARWIKSGRREPFFLNMGRRYAPDDFTNWSRNVECWYWKLSK